MNILITGTSSGIGKALAQKYLAAGHTVFGISRRNTWKSTNFNWISANLTGNDRLISDTITSRITTDIQLDRIVCNAGTFSENATKFNNTHNLIVLQLENRLHKSSKIVQISSIFHIANGDYLKDISPSYHAYCQSKMMQIEWCSIWNRCSDIKAIAIHPGAVKTQLFADLYFFRNFIDLITITPKESANQMYHMIEKEPDTEQTTFFNYNITRPFLLSK